jgi:hypothetical protein
MIYLRGKLTAPINTPTTRQTQSLMHGENRNREEGGESADQRNSQIPLMQSSSNGGVAGHGRGGILIFPKDLLLQSASSAHSSNSSPNLSFVTLPHPRYGHNIEFIQVDSHHLYEFQIIQSRKFGSWFIDQRVCSNSSFYLLSKYDIRFLFLPFFISTSTKYSPLSQILYSNPTTDEHQVNEMRKIQLKYQNEWKLDEICDVNDKLGEDMILYRLNSEKLLSWLREKVTRMTQVIYQKRKHREASESRSLFDSSFQSKNKDENSVDLGDAPTDEDSRTALTIILDYLPDSTALQLLQSYDLTMESFTSNTQNFNKRKADWEAALEVFFVDPVAFSHIFRSKKKLCRSLLQE